MRHISIWMVMSTSKTVHFGLQRTRESYTWDLSMLLRFQFGAAFRKWGWLVLTFFEEGAIVTVTSGHYVEMLRNFLRPQLRSLRVNMEEMWFLTRWSHSPHGKGFDDSCSTYVSATRSLAFRRCPLAPTLTRFICLRFLSLGLPQIKSLRWKTSYSRRSESFHSRRNVNCATRNVSKCYAELWGEATDVCTARRAPSFPCNFP